MADLYMRAAKPSRGHSDTAGGDTHSDVSRSQQRVRDWIKMTEDNMTSSGVSETDGTDTSSRIGAPNHNSTRVVVQEPDSSSLSQESWDRFQTVPRDEHWGETRFTTLLRCVKIVWICLLFLVVLGSGVTNKLAMLTLTSSIVQDGGSKAGDPRPTMLLVALCFPYVCHCFFYSARSLFGASHWPSLRVTVTILFIEMCHTAGLCLLLFRILPRVDMLRALVLLTSVYVTPSLLNLVTTASSKVTSGCQRFMLTCTAMVTFLIQAGNVGVVTYQGYLYNSTEASRLSTAARTALTDTKRGLGIQRSPATVGQDIAVELPLAIILTSFGFWENFIDGEFRLCGLTINMRMWKGRLNLVRQRLYIMISIFKISISILLSVLLTPGFNFTFNFPPDVIASLTSVSANSSEQHLRMYGPLYAMLVSGIICSYMSGLACKLCMQVMGFAIPLSLVTPVSVTVLVLECQYQVLDTPSTPFTWLCPPPLSGLTSWDSSLLLVVGVLWVSQLMLTSHVWRPSSGRMDKIDRLFITPMRCAILTEHTLMAKRRIVYSKNFQITDGDGTLLSEDVSGRTENVPLIYACATMWHETRKEMVQLMKSIFRMDIDRSARFIAQKYYNIKDPEYYDFEAHIFFDDAITVTDDHRHLPNNFVATFMDCLDDALSAVHERPTSLGDPVRTPTPYGGRLTWILPGGTPLVVHFKDKNKIRHKKRWSQVMYMYYLLGFKILANSELQPDQEPEFDSVSGVMKKSDGSVNMARAKLTSSELRRRRAAAHFTRSIIFNYVPEEVQIQAENTYILALDGDVDFKPDAVRLLMDRMKKNTKVGAACGRIHPTGSGPIVWYQKFEYAIGHWLQKATEHVFGCVLCAPGCFSLFRGSALMDDNIVKTYATRSIQAAHYVQYDQGEDRWLSTLLLQQGYRIDYTAAADALTHAPETFSEFFNQRRRWGPSTLANLMDLIGDWRSCVRLNDNLSTLYMVYQCMMLVSTVLGPATILLLMAGSFRVVFKISVVESYALTLMVPVAYMAVCLYAKPSLQLKMGALLSALYALVMTIVLVGTVGTAIDGSITSPNVLFLFTVILIFSVSGLVHPQELYCVLPGILYLIMIPAGYLVLTIYFLTNLHVVSWGTRETQAPVTPPPQQQPADSTTTTTLQKKKKKKQGGILGWSGAHHLVKEAGKVLKMLQESLFHKEKRDQPSSRTNQLLEELIVELRRQRSGVDMNENPTGPALLTCPSNVDELTSVSVDPQEPANAQSHVHSSGDNELQAADDRNTIRSTGHRTVDVIIEQPICTEEKEKQEQSSHARTTVDDMAASWLTSGACGEGPMTELTSREAAFWRQLINTYLYPLVEDKAHLEQVNTDLKALRNTVVFGFAMTSAIWIALTMQLEVLQNDLEAYLFIQLPRFNQGPPLRFQPLGLFFLGSFAFILLTQFLGMFSHRWGTLLHTLSIIDLGIGSKETEQSKAREAILRVIELQRLRNIELEPEPDYDEPLVDYNNLDNSVSNPVYMPDPADNDNSYFHFRENDVRADGTLNHVGRARLSIPTSSHPGFSFRPYQHAKLVPDVLEDGWDATRISSGMGGAEGRGPLGHFTLQRAFERRYRNEMGLRVNRLQPFGALFDRPPQTLHHQSAEHHA